MKTQTLLLSAWALALAANAQSTDSMAPPSTPKRPVVDTYFGKAVTDNYRWLEDSKSPEAEAWFKAQADYSNATLEKIPGRDALIETFKQYDALKSASVGDIKLRAGKYFYRKTLPGQKVGKIYYRVGLTAPEQLLFDPLAYDSAKTYSVTDFNPSRDGTRMTIGLTEGGAAISTVLVLNVFTRKLLPDQIKGIWGGVVAWTPDGSGFLYTPQNSLDLNDPKGSIDTRALYHQLGTDPNSDIVVLSREKYATFGIRPDQIPDVSYDQQYTHLFGTLFSVDQRLNVLMAPTKALQSTRIDWQRLITPEDSIYGFGVEGGKLFLHSVKGAPRGKILVTNAQKPNVKTATVLLANPALPKGELNLTNFSLSRDYLFVTLNDGINDQIRQYDIRSNRWTDVPLPSAGQCRLLPMDPTRNDCLLLTTSWKQPDTWYIYDPMSHQTTLSPFHVRATYPGVDELVVDEVEVPSHDGVLVPLSLMYKKGLKRDGNAVCFMEGYGAYGHSAKPGFNPRLLAMLNKGVVVAITHIRGGSEKGQMWYKAGYKTTKPNTWKDFIACGEYLVRNKYTSPNHLIGMGYSAGGILVGRAITERPDLFAAAINHAGVTNVLRMESSLNGPVNAPEFGTVTDSTECMALYEMDALQHVKDGVNYPAVLCVGGWNDPSVVVWQPGKFAAALQNASASGKPMLMQVNYDNGHSTEDKAVTFRNYANMYTFGLWQAGHPDFQLPIGHTK